MNVQETQANLTLLQQTFANTGVKVDVGKGKTTDLACFTLDIGGDRKVQLYDKKSWDNNVSGFRRMVSEWRGLTEVVKIGGKDFVVVKPTLREAQEIRKQIASVAQEYMDRSAAVGSDTKKIGEFQKQMAEKIAEKGRDAAKLLSKTDVDSIFQQLLKPKETKGQDREKRPVTELPQEPHQPIDLSEIDRGIDNLNEPEAQPASWTDDVRKIHKNAIQDRFTVVLNQEGGRDKVKKLSENGSKEECRQFLEALRQYDKEGQWKPSNQERGDYRDSTIFGNNQTMFNSLWDKAFPRK